MAKEQTKKETMPTPAYRQAGGRQVKKGEFRGKHVVLHPYVSEKSQRVIRHNQYSFLVTNSANKVLVREEIERTYGVHVSSVTMTKVRVRTKHYRGHASTFKPKKKATVRLRAGEKIDIA